MRLIDLAQWVFDEFRISISKQTLSREMRAVGFRKLWARPRHHAQDARRGRHADRNLVFEAEAEAIESHPSQRARADAE